MQDVSEVKAPPSKMAPADPYGAANTKLDPVVKERIEAIQKARSNVYGTTPVPVQNTRSIESQSSKAFGGAAVIGGPIEHLNKSESIGHEHDVTN